MREVQPTPSLRGLKLSAMCVAFLFASCLPPPLWIITSVAGTGVRDFSGDGGPAVLAQLDWPTGIAADGIGNIYVSDSDNHRVRKIDASGIITTVAGTGSPGPAGDGGLAVNAELWFPYGLAVDGDGNLYIADSSNYRVRKVDATGVITTVAGNGEANISCGRFCIAVPYEGDGGDGGPAVDGMLFWPQDVDIDDDGNLYITERGMERVRKVDTNGVITTFAGTGTRGYSGDGGPASDAEFADPCGVAVSGDDVFIAEYRNHTVRRVDSNGVITTVAGTGQGGFSGDGGPAASARISSPCGIAASGSGGFVFVSQSSGRLRAVLNGMIGTIVGEWNAGPLGDGGPAKDGQLNLPWDVTLAPDGSIYIADSSNHAIRRVWPGGGAIGGTITDASGVVPNMTVRLYEASDPTVPVATTTSNRWGIYGFRVTTGSYLVELVGDGTYEGEWWNDAVDVSLAEVITLGAGDVVRADAEVGLLP